jgi:hypothetical protein
MQMQQIIIRLFVSSLLSLISCSLQAQEVEKFEANGFVFSLSSKELKAITNGCSDFLASLKVTNSGRTIYSESFCIPDKKDVRFHLKGYLTVIEYYSSPVGWTKYHIFDLCKRRLMITRKIEENEVLAWEDFIELKDITKKKFIEKVEAFK